MSLTAAVNTDLRLPHVQAMERDDRSACAGVPQADLLARVPATPYSGVMAVPDLRQVTREILLGFWKVHILHHAAEQPIVGQWILAELRRHGYDISPGTIYPLLQRMERNGWLRSRTARNAGVRAPRYYTLTPLGHAVLKIVRGMLVELYEETVEHAAEPTRSGSKRLASTRERPKRSARR